MNRTATTAEVAAELSMRPDTVRSHARNGRIPSDRTSRGYRFDIDEVRAALQGQAAASSVTPSARFRGASRWLADALDLEAWAERMAARHQLPELVRMLVAGSTRDLRRMDFRVGEGVGMPGWDGLVDSSRGNAWVPEGCSAWEMGVNEDVLSKADSDYAARTDGPEGLVPAETVFVFVTPRRWSQRDTWASEKGAEGVWKDVRAYDADSLEQWLNQTPAVHVQVTRMLGRDPEGAIDLVSAWHAWSAFTAPPLPAALMTAGREEQVRAVLAWLNGAPSELIAVGESSEEAFAFIASCLLELPEPERTALDARTLVVRTTEAWDEVLARAGSHNSLVLIPTFPQPQTRAAVDAGHHVAVPVDSNAVRPATGIALPRLRCEPAREALITAGLPEREARELALVARRSLLVLRRRLAVGVGARPAWAQPEQGSELVPIVLAGAWRVDFDGDKQVLSDLMGRPFDEIEALCTRWASETDAPVRNQGNVWFCVSKQDAWGLLSHLVTRKTLKCLQETTVKIFTTVDPAFELAPDQRWTAGAFGHLPPFSPQLRTNLAETLAMIAARSGDRQLPVGNTCQEFADAIVDSILSAANDDHSGTLWSSLSDVMPLLAEASPERFLDAIDIGMTDDSSLLGVFDPEAESAPFGFPTHTGLLWALERLAWSAEHLGAAALALARLAQCDPGGRWSNRPSHSLNQIFLPWHPQTTADAEQRLQAIEMLRKRAASDVTWSLLISLLPTPHSIGQSTDQPRWREWADNQPDQGDIEQWLLQAAPLVERLLPDAARDGSRWAALISAVPSLPEAPGNAILDQLKQLVPEQFKDEDRALLLDALRKVVRDHRRFKDARWALPPERVDHFEEQLRRLSTAADTAWLFASHVQLPDFGPMNHSAEDYAAEQRIVAERQQLAAQETFAAGGIEAIWALSAKSEVPFLLGRALARAGISNADEEIVAELGTADRSRSQLASGYVNACFERGGRPWAEEFLSRAGTWPAARTAAFLQQVTADADTFDRVAQLGPDVRDLYWGNVSAFLIHPADRARAVRTLLETGHPSPAVDLLVIDLHENQTTDPELAIQALMRATGEDDGNISGFVYNVTQLLEFLNTHPDVDRHSLSLLEWRYLGVLDHHERPTRLLHEELARNPHFFADVIEAIFQGRRGDDDRQPIEDRRRLAEHAYRLLESWQTSPGGVEPDYPSLEDWVHDARVELTNRGLLRNGDPFIGKALARVGADSDETWPGERVREIIEAARSSGLEKGIVMAVFNSGGPTWRSLDTGGQPERARADKYRTYAGRVGTGWPRTRGMLRRIAEEWDREARREDHLTELREDFWS